MRVEELMATISGRARDHGVASLPPDHRLLFVAWHGSAAIAGDGLAHFFAQGGDIDELERAYRRLGLLGAAAACTTARQLFPPEHRFADRAATETFLRTNADDLHWAFRSISHGLLGATGAGLRAATIAHLRALGVIVE